MDNNKPSQGEISDKERRKRGKKEYEMKEVMSLGGFEADGEARGIMRWEALRLQGATAGETLTAERVDPVEPVHRHLSF